MNIYPHLLALGLFVLPLLGIAQPAQRVNLAKFQPVTSSSQSGTYIADFATDGIVSNFHSLRSPNITNHFWPVEVTYLRPTTIASAHLYTGLLESATPTQILTGFRLQYYDDFTAAWVTITSVLNNTATEVAVTFPQAVTATRFRLLGISNGNSTIRELAFFPPNLVGGIEQGFPLGTDVQLNLARQRPASASSAQLNNIYGPGYAKNAFDGYIDNASRWIAATDAAGQHLEIDLLSSHRVGSAHLYAGFSDPAAPATVTLPLADFTLQYLDPATSSWLPVPGATITGNTQTARVVEFTTPVTTSRIRLVTASASVGRVQELLVFPPRPGGGSYPLGQDVVHSAPPSAKWDTYSDSFYRLRNVGPDRRLGLVNGAVLNTSADNNNPLPTEWQLLLNHRDGTYRVRNAVSGLCLALAQISLAADTPVTAEEYSGLPHQDWRLRFIDASQFHLVNAYSGLALQPANSSYAVGSSLVVRPAVANNVQYWTTSFRRHFPKKGIAATSALIRTSSNPYVTTSDLTFHQDHYQRYNGSWSYGWGRQSAATLPYLAADFTHAYNPMQWGNFSWDHGSNQGPPENRHRELQASPKPVHFMGFNEPEHETQGYILPENAILRWPRLEARDVPLVAPVPASIQVNSSTNPATPAAGWMNDFVTAADALGYRRDYTSVHWYAAPNATSLINHLENIYEAYKRPVWLTEFSTADWNQNSSWTDAANFNFLAEFMWRAESLPWLKRYSIFTFIEADPNNPNTNPNQGAPDPLTAPRSNTLRADGSLTAFGELYAGWDGVAAVVNDKAYHLHNKSVYRRVQNPGQPAIAPTDLVTSVSPETSATGNQWFLVPGTTANTVRIVSTLDNRRLRYWNGTYVGMAPATTITGQVEWRLDADVHGWFFISHPQSGARLRIDTNGTPLHGSGTATSDEYKWRFVRPAVPDFVGPPAAPANLALQATTTALDLSWAPVSHATRYTVSRATAATGPWTALNSNVTSTAYADTTAVLGTTYYFQVTATTLLAYTSAPSAVVSGALLPPPTPYETWVSARSWPEPVETSSVPDADPDADGLTNLIEYALNLDPLAPSSGPSISTTTLNSETHLQLSFLRARAELTYEILASSTLAPDSWTVIFTNPGSVSLTVPVTVTDTVPVSENPRRFLRLRVSQP
jgi:hypothetical protein